VTRVGSARLAITGVPLGESDRADGVCRRWGVRRPRKGVLGRGADHGAWLDRSGGDQHALAPAAGRVPRSRRTRGCPSVRGVCGRIAAGVATHARGARRAIAILPGRRKRIRPGALTGASPHLSFLDRSDLPPSLARLAARCLAKHPDHRVQGALDPAAARRGPPEPTLPDGGSMRPTRNACSKGAERCEREQHSPCGSRLRQWDAAGVRHQPSPHRCLPASRRFPVGL
jgi:hypothetical protein